MCWINFELVWKTRITSIKPTKPMIQTSPKTLRHLQTYHNLPPSIGVLLDDSVSPGLLRRATKRGAVAKASLGQLQPDESRIHRYSLPIYLSICLSIHLPLSILHEPKNHNFDGKFLGNFGQTEIAMENHRFWQVNHLWEWTCPTAILNCHKATNVYTHHM